MRRFQVYNLTATRKNRLSLLTRADCCLRIPAAPVQCLRKKIKRLEKKEQNSLRIVGKNDFFSQPVLLVRQCSLVTRDKGMVRFAVCAYAALPFRCGGPYVVHVDHVAWSRTAIERVRRRPSAHR